MHKNNQANGQLQIPGRPRGIRRCRAIIGFRAACRLNLAFGGRERKHCMGTEISPRDFPEWRTGQFDRPEDAAYTFGYFLIKHCRDEAMATVAEDAPPEIRSAVEKAVDVALHNVCDLLEGFWQLQSGSGHRVALVLGVQVSDSDGQVIETQEISPCKLDLPIGYWKWAQEREFQ